MQHVIQRLNEKIKESYLAFMKVTKVGAYFNLVGSMFSLLSVIFIFFLSVKLISTNQLSVGEFIIVFNFYNSLNGYITKVFGFGEQQQKYNVAMDRLQDVICKYETFGGTVTFDTINNIQLKDVSYTIDGKVIIENFNYTFTKGYCYLITGINGSGKSTLFDILTTIIAPCTGSYKINNIDFREVNLESFRENNVALALQNMIILDESIDLNINLSKRETLGMFELPVNEVGNGLSKALSGGEKRKITLERALSKKAGLLLLDEPETF